MNWLLIFVGVVFFLGIYGMIYISHIVSITFLNQLWRHKIDSEMEYGIVTLRLSGHLVDAMNRQAEQTENSAEELFRRALCLFFTAAEAHKHGHELVIVTQSGQIVTRLEGLVGEQPKTSYRRHLSLVSMKKDKDPPPKNTA